jgi:hypothetical protein
MTLLTIVCCTPDKPERKRHMEELCRDEGLEPVFTTDAGLFVHRDDPLVAALRGDFPENAAYRAHYLTYLRALRYFLATGATHALVMEDDVVRCAEVRAAHAIEHAPEFDALFLEYCAADGANARWAYKSGGVVYVGGYEAYGTGACAYTREGARRVLEFAEATPTTIDSATRMYASTERGHSHVAYAHPRAYRQDRERFCDGVSADIYYAAFVTAPAALDAAIAQADYGLNEQ